MVGTLDVLYSNTRSYLTKFQETKMTFDQSVLVYLVTFVVDLLTSRAQ